MRGNIKRQRSSHGLFVIEVIIMRQRISVRALIKQDGKILLIRRANGRDSLMGKYELPGGKLEYREQPEDSLARHVLSDIGVNIETTQLADVLTYVDKDDLSLQYVFIIFNASLDSVNKLKLSQNYNKYKWAKPSELDRNDLTESTEILLGISQVEDLQELGPPNDVEETSLNDTITVFTDGGSRGNPGPSASSYIIFGSNNAPLAQGGQYLGVTTNSLAEYHGVRLGLEAALRLQPRSIVFKVDSLLVVNQLNGLYSIKNKELWPVHERIKSLIERFDRVSFVHVKREFNTLADGIVNKILDEHGKDGL